MREPAGQSVMWPCSLYTKKRRRRRWVSGSVRFAVRNGRGPYYLNHPKYKKEYKELHKHVMHEEGFNYDE